MADESGNNSTLRKLAPRVRFLSGNAVHARASNPAVDFVDVIGINIGGGQSPSMSDIDLFVDINTGPVDLSHQKRHYELSLRRLRIILEKENANVQPGTYYKAILQRGSFAASDNEMEYSNRELKAEGSAGAQFSGGLTSWLTAKLSISGKGTGDITSNRNTEAQNKIVYQVDLVTPSGQDSWIAGGPEGDPRRRTKDLRGGIIGDGSGDRNIPLCGLEAIDATEPVSGRIRVRAGETDFVLAEAEVSDEVMSALFASLKDDKEKFIERRIRAERELKGRVASFAMFKLRKSRRDPKENEVDLAIESFLFEPDIIAEK